VPFEQIASILSIVGMGAGIAAFAVVHGLRTALGAAKEVIESLEKSYEIMKRSAEEALRGVAEANTEIAGLKSEIAALKQVVEKFIAKNATQPGDA
jgi:hypothetical protein